jgi:malonyl-CoA decarboxylase
VLDRILRSLGRDGPKAGSVRQARAAVEICAALVSERGEVSGGLLASKAIDAYRSLDDAGRQLYFDLILDAFSPKPAALLSALDAYQQDSSHLNLLRLQQAVESPRQELFRRFNLAPGGTAALLALRAEVLRTLNDHPDRMVIDADLLHLFRSWFNRGFLVLQRIDWRTPALVLERLIQYEAVHAIQGWKDLRSRLEADRRCYAYFHPALQDEPLIFIEVALTKGMSTRVQPLLDSDAPVGEPKSSNCAIFYSITNCQEGLRGVSFGNFLIKQVVEDLGREFPKLRIFATLSPMPGFQRWLSTAGRNNISAELASLLASADLRAALAELSDSSGLKTELMRLAADYLLKAKSDAVPLDPVARFHLANGASLQRVNWMGDTSEAGIQRSLGLMVNYVYRLEDLERNHEAYAKHQKVIASREFERHFKRVATHRHASISG